MVKGGKKRKSERVAERKKKEEEYEGPAEVISVGLEKGALALLWVASTRGVGALAFLWAASTRGICEEYGEGKALTSPNCIKYATLMRGINSSHNLSIDCTLGLFRRIICHTALYI